MTYESMLQEREELGCRCCPSFLMDGYDCICKEEQVIEFNDGTEHKYWSRGECCDYDCSYCH